MKIQKPFYLLLFLFLLDVINSNAQSFDLLDSNNTVINGDTIFLTGDSASFLNVGIKVRNNNNAAKNVAITKMIIYSDPGIISTFSWGTLMYDSTAYWALGWTINSGAVDSSFFSNCRSSGNFGSFRMMYVFYDENNPDDSVWVIIQNDFIHTTGIEEKRSGVYSFYPNPGMDVFSCSLASVINSEFAVDVYNATGNLVMRKKFPSGSSFFTVDLGDYPAGIYYLRISDVNNVFQGYQKIVKM